MNSSGESGVILRGLETGDMMSAWSQAARRLNYDLCDIAHRARDLSQQLDAQLDGLRKAQEKGPTP